MISQTHKLDVVPGGVTAVVHVKQYQTGESLVFELFSRFGDFEISAAFTECTVRGTKSDGNGYSANATCDPSNNSVTVELTEQMTAVAGRQPYEITITESTGRMITTTFILDVHRAALDADTVESESVIKEVQTIVEEYIEENPGLFVVDPTLTQSGEAADAKVTGDEIADLKSAISGGIGIPADVKEALLNCFENVAWINDQGQTYYDALEEALYPPANLISISAVYTQSGTVYNTDTLDSLKTDLVVTAHYEDSTTAIVTNYTLSGTLTVGTSTITVSYGGFTDEFGVTVTKSTDWESGVPYDMTDGITSDYYLNNGSETSYNGWSISPYLKCNGAFIYSDTDLNIQNYNALYDAEKTYINKFALPANKYMNFDELGATFVRVSESTSKITGATITPYLFSTLTETTVWETNRYYTAEFPVNGYINTSNGQVIEMSGYKCTSFLNCYNSTKITNNYPVGVWQKYSFYDFDKQYISSVEIATSGAESTGEVTVPSGARYVRISKAYPSIGLCFKLS